MNKNLFEQIQLKTVKKNVFDLSHDVKCSARFGELFPIMAMDCVPGDQINIGAESLIRFAPMVAPVMHRYNAYIHYFFVPNRLLWDNWVNWIVDPQTTIVHPYIRFSGVIANTDSNWRLLDFMGVPRSTNSAAGSGEDINALPLAAYQMIYNEFYRDQNLVAPINFKLTDGLIGGRPELSQIRVRAWEHDYFTSALPFAQKGTPVNIPVGTIANDFPVRTRVGTPGATTLTGAPASVPIQADTPTGGFSDGIFAKSSGTPLASTTISDLRRAFRLQEFLEKSARAGTRYIEHLKAFFNVSAQDSRLQRPEYITGVSTPIIVSEVLNTTGPTAGLPQGNMAGHGVGVMQGSGKGYYCHEHGWIIGIMSVLPKPAYQQGIERQFLRHLSPLDYFFPEFAHIGEQAVTNNELYAYQSAGAGLNTFGYVPRYSEYKYKPSRVATDFRTSLNFWHSSRIFANPPALNQAFVECVPDNRIFSVVDPTVDKMYIHVFNKVRAIRPMPYFGSPRM